MLNIIPVAIYVHATITSWRVAADVRVVLFVSKCMVLVGLHVTLVSWCIPIIESW